MLTRGYGDPVIHSARSQEYLYLYKWGRKVLLGNSRQHPTCILPTGESNTVVSPTVPGGLSDGQWHTVHLRYYNKVVITPGIIWAGYREELGC